MYVCFCRYCEGARVSKHIFVYKREIWRSTERGYETPGLLYLREVEGVLSCHRRGSGEGGGGVVWSGGVCM